MMRKLLAMLACLAWATVASATPTADVAVLTQQLEAFLDGASRNDAAAHDRFWDDDLIYTGSSGRRVTKADIMKDVRSSPAPRPEDPRTGFSAEDVRVHTYGQSAVVAFRLVGKTTTPSGAVRVARYLNTGTFLKRKDGWRAVSWQATRLPIGEPEAREAVTAAAAAFRSALAKPDSSQLASLTDTTFVWTRGGERVSRKQMINEMKSVSLTIDSLTVTVRGEAAVARGSSGTGGIYTLTFYLGDGEWKALSLETSQP